MNHLFIEPPPSIPEDETCPSCGGTGRSYNDGGKGLCVWCGGTGIDPDLEVAR